MKIQRQSTPSLNQLCRLVEHMSVAMVTTSDAQDQLASRPMVPLEMDSDGILWFFADLRSTMAEQVNQLNLSFSDMNQGTYVSICGRGEIHVDQPRIDELWTAFSRPWFADGRTSSNLALLKVVPAKAEYWDARERKMLRLVAMATSKIPKEPTSVEEHNTLANLAPRQHVGSAKHAAYANAA